MDFRSEKLQLKESWKVEEGMITSPVSFMSETVTHDGLKLCEEIEKTWQIWKNNPVTFDHPNQNTLKYPDGVIGFLRNVEENDDKRRLEGEICIYKEPPSFSDMKESYWNVMIEELKNRDEISAGYYTIIENEEGKFTDIYENELEYDRIYRKIFPDHLASVDRGVCSPDQGCSIDLESDILTAQTVLLKKLTMSI